jgi:predicted glycogen debranching enzyme
VEKDRGLDFREDLFQPFVLHSEGPVTVVATVDPEVRAFEPCVQRTSPMFGDAQLERLSIAAEQFLVQRGAGKTVIAGYPWFSDWGRDTMISLPGLTLVTGRFDDARGILAAYAAAMSEGMLPNRFPDSGEMPEYNTVDATLWFFEAIRSYLEYTGDLDFVRETLYPKMREAMDWHFRGTRYGIHLDRSDGLLACGAPGVQLTWMDAKVGEWVVTPRAGKPVEIQALWYNALCIMAELAHNFGDTGGLYALIAARIRWNFLPKFWNEAAGCLFDVVDGEQKDASIRPNQIFAVSLRHMLLTPETARQVVATVERELLTPRGLRTLSPHDAKYKGEFRGGVLERDSAYHQGTAWPWLMGPFLSAWRKTGGDPARALEIWRACATEPFAEVADGDAPHRPGGCFSQAWTVAELLRAGVEDVFPTALGSA